MTHKQLNYILSNFGNMSASDARYFYKIIKRLEKVNLNYTHLKLFLDYASSNEGYHISNLLPYVKLLCNNKISLKSLISEYRKRLKCLN